MSRALTQVAKRLTAHAEKKFVDGIIEALQQPQMLCATTVGGKCGKIGTSGRSFTLAKRGTDDLDAGRAKVISKELSGKYDRIGTLTDYK